MNQYGPNPSYEQPQDPNAPQQMNEIPSYPVAPDQYPQNTQNVNTGYNQETQTPPPQPYVPIETPKPVYSAEQAPSPANVPYAVSEQQPVPTSKMPEMQTPLEYQTTKEGERYFNNPELGQSTFKGGVTAQQIVSRVSGYYTVQSTLVSQPQSGLLQQTAQSGDPHSATTWQASIVYKVLQAIWKMLGLI